MFIKTVKNQFETCWKNNNKFNFENLKKLKKEVFRLIFEDKLIHTDKTCLFHDGINSDGI